MWSAVAPCDVESPAPSARSKHSATLVGQHLYLLGGRNGNLPLKDFWKYNLVTGKWQQLKPSGDKLPCLQEHSAVVHKDNIYVFGGEVGFSAGSETPLWMYDIKNNNWKKIRTHKGAVTPKGRRGHSALVHKGTMLIYGGYQDLRGSCSELWGYHFDSGSWHLISSTTKSNPDLCPPPRHKHSAILHEDAMWVYGGMTDLQERSDLWKWDTVSSTWTNFKAKQHPGPLHSHAACHLPSSMIIFGGEREGHSTNDLWRFSFTTEMWEKIVVNGVKPQPRAETVALTVSQLLLKETLFQSLEAGAARTRARTCNSADRGGRHSSYLPTNRVSPFEKTYVFKASTNNYIDGSETPAQQQCENGNGNNKGGFLQEISKLSNLNISRLNNKCSYTVLAGCTTDSTESLLRQYASPQGIDNDLVDNEIATPTRGTLVKSKSAYVIKRRDMRDVSPIADSEKTKDVSQKNQRHVEFVDGIKKIPREPISVPNFSVITLPTPVLTPVEAARLVFLDSDEETDADDIFIPPAINNITQVKTNNSKDFTIYSNFKVVKRGDSYNSHIGYADNPLYQHIVGCNTFQDTSEVAEASNENISSTSDYASIETVNRLSSASSYSAKVTPQEEFYVPKNGEGPFGFCNPNYLGPDINALIAEDCMRKKNFSKLLNTPDSVLDDSGNGGKNINDCVELQSYGTIDRNTKVRYSNSTRNAPPTSLVLDRSSNRTKQMKYRASSASRAEKNCNKTEPTHYEDPGPINDYVPLYVFVIGGKEQGQVTVFKRPLSIWRLKLF
ncbi:hypothetical protein PPYR_11334 [Photinus pyralis]|uniref:Uncharacterized protein n=3 Tax=Photinus pyralis TaxID=7054 RepID=A0A5N4AAY8_PHOPY|nr:uncharacterized protein LOC116176665 [Photinus pyralis]XP_031351249.1 uncharacterized protein LOC116176665 [Photinus pyralis]XP_031351250.1 uncharacterized protein LOC116176665 [Photinus pyralis]XP_031351251.1 uncharacterized protein LOC116176665 [Photinus pyralis]KAB0794495.1 hypothetical protein PPYR_11334 [Photinus pyralis]